MSVADDKLRRAADNAMLVLVSRWATVMLVPISLMFGGWLITTVQQLVIDVKEIRVEQKASTALFEEKLQNLEGSLTTRQTSVERRVERLETIEDRRVYKAK
jgi:hypothetical protein